MNENMQIPWWRFDSYEIKDGGIQPSPGAVLSEYDLWAAYTERVSGRQKETPPYDELLMLYRASKRSKKGSIILTPKVERRLLDWGSRYGLTGVLLQEVEEITLAPQPPFGKSFGSNNYYNALTAYIRSGKGKNGWSSVFHETEKNNASTRENVDLSPHVIRQALGEEKKQRESLGRNWARFFPAVPHDSRESYGYPRPGNEKFWFLYAEPLEDFFRGAAFLFRALEHLSPLVNSSYTDLDPDDSEVVDDGLDMLERLMLPVHPRLSHDENAGFMKSWFVPSLLAGLAMMIREDLTTKGRHLYECHRCERLFIAGSYKDIKFCSSRCRNAAYAKRRPKQGGNNRSS